MNYSIQRFFFRMYRKLKKYYLTHPVRFDTHIFFFMLAIADKILSPRVINSQNLYLWKQLYFLRFGVAPLFVLKSKEPVANNSHDHKWPRGTVLDNSLNREFNLKLYSFFDYRANLKVLDLGCSGGGFVRSFLEDGHTAIGIEGSDTSKKLRSAEWDACPFHLFTADITSPFLLVREKTPILFDCITMWEVLEHIPENKLAILFENIKSHLSDDGIFVGSIDMAPDGNPIKGITYHLTLKPKKWWLEKFSQSGLIPLEQHPFTKSDYVRGHGKGLKDWDPDDGEGFHVVLRKSS